MPTTQLSLELWSGLLLASLLIAGVLYLYRLFWQERYRQPNDFGQKTVRLGGQVSGPGRPGSVVYCTGSDGSELLGLPFCLEHPTGAREVLPRGAVLAGPRLRTAAGQLRCLRVGQKVTLDAIVTTIEEPAGLYRQAGRREILEAVRIAAGCWPELRWLRALTGLCGLLALLSLGQVLYALRPDPLPLRDQALAARATSAASQPLAQSGIRLQRLDPGEGLLTDQTASSLFAPELLSERDPARTLWVCTP